MPDNIDQFSIYTAKIFEILYDSFPVPTCINRRETIEKYLVFNNKNELRNLRAALDLATIADYSDDNELRLMNQEKSPAIRARISQLDYEQRSDIARQEHIFEGTLEFLCWEGFIRERESGRYQLTAKGFSHLNKSFTGSKIGNAQEKNISILKAVFEKSSDTSLQVAAGTAVNVLTKMMGYG